MAGVGAPNSLSVSQKKRAIIRQYFLVLPDYFFRSIILRVFFDFIFKLFFITVLTLN